MNTFPPFLVGCLACVLNIGPSQCKWDRSQWASHALCLPSTTPSLLVCIPPLFSAPTIQHAQQKQELRDSWACERAAGEQSVVFHTRGNKVAQSCTLVSQKSLSCVDNVLILWVTGSGIVMRPGAWETGTVVTPHSHCTAGMIVQMAAAAPHPINSCQEPQSSHPGYATGLRGTFYHPIAALWADLGIILIGFIQNELVPGLQAEKTISTEARLWRTEKKEKNRGNIFRFSKEAWSTHPWGKTFCKTMCCVNRGIRGTRTMICSCFLPTLHSNTNSEKLQHSAATDTHEGHACAVFLSITEIQALGT